MKWNKNKRLVLNDIIHWVSELSPEDAESLAPLLEDLIQTTVDKRNGLPYRVILNESSFIELLDKDPDILRMEEDRKTRRVPLSELISLETLLNKRYQNRVLCIPDDFDFATQNENPAKLVLGISAVIDSSYRPNGLSFVRSCIPYELTEKEYMRFVEETPRQFYLGYVVYVDERGALLH